MALSASSDGAAGALFQSTVQAAGVDIHLLSPLAQVQLAIASIYADAPPGSVAAGDIASGTFGANIPDTGTYAFPGTVTILGALVNLSTAGAAFAFTGTTVASVADTASGAITMNANIGRGTGAVGGFVFAVPVTTSTGTTAQTLTNALVVKATTVPLVFMSGTEALPVGLITTTAGASVAQTAMVTVAVGAAAFTQLLRVNGSLATPTILLTGQVIGSTAFRGCLTASTSVTAASIVATTTEGWVASTASGAKLTFNVTPNTTTGVVAALTLDQDKTATFTGTVKCPVSTTALASLNLGNAGTAPTSPANGDMWIESNTIKVRLNGATVTVQTA